MLPTLKSNAAEGYQGPVKIEKGAGLPRSERSRTFEYFMMKPSLLVVFNLKILGKVRLKTKFIGKLLSCSSICKTAVIW